MDLQTLIAERRRVADASRATTTYLVMLRAHLTRGDLTEEARRHLLPVIEYEETELRRLSEKLMELDAAILKMQAASYVPSGPSPLLSAPADF